MRLLLFGGCLALLSCGCSTEPEPVKSGPAFSDNDLAKVEQWANALVAPLYKALETGAEEADLRTMADDVTATIVNDLKPFVGTKVNWEVPFRFVNGRAIVIVECSRKRFALIPSLVGVVGEIPVKGPDQFGHSVAIDLPLTKSEAAKYQQTAMLSAVVERFELTLVPGNYRGIIGFIIHVYLKDAEISPPNGP